MAAAGMEEDDYAPRRTSTPLARLDDQRAGFPAASSASSTPFGSPSAQPPPMRTRRPSPKSAGSASLPAKPQRMLRREESWEDDSSVGASGGRGRGRRASLRKIEMTPTGEGGGGGSGEGPFSDPLRSDWGASQSDLSSLPPRSPDLDFRRRSSAVSTSSALSSYSPHHTSFFSRPLDGSSFHTNSRHSISSFGGHTLNTIGDMSNSSMPLLVKQPTRESQHTRSYSVSSSRDGRPRATNTGSGGPIASGRPSSAYSFSQQSDASSVHSYPPRPRQRTRSTTGSSEDGGGESWARELERTSATGQIKREKSREAKSDPWPAFVTASYIHQPVARPAAAYQSSLSSYSFPGPSTRTPPIPVNPLAPLRKRLARSLASTNSHERRLNTEVQLLLELIDALEHCITSFAPSSGTTHRASGDSNASSSSARPSTASSSRSAVFDDPLSAHSSSSSTRLSASTSSSSHTPSLNGQSTPIASSSTPSRATPPASTSASPAPPPPRSGQSKSSLVDEVRLLVRELVELVPDASRCLINGQYGPLSRPGGGGGASTKALIASLEDDRAGGGGRESPEWWPRRLAKDCRALLEEAGLQVGVGVGATAAAASSVGWNEEDAGEDEREKEAAEGEGTSRGGKAGGGGGAGSSSSSSASSSSRPSGSGAGGRGAVFRRDSEDGTGTGWSESRREELLMQGKQRWEAYKAKVEELKQYEG